MEVLNGIGPEESLLNKYLPEMSGGQSQSAAIRAALTTNPFFALVQDTQIKWKQGICGFSVEVIHEKSL